MAGRKVELYDLREGLRRWTTNDRQAGCGDRPVGAVSIRVVAGRQYHTGLVTCANLWTCPVCAQRIQSRRSEEVADILSQHLAAGGGCEMLTMTTSHDTGDDLRALRVMVQTAWAKVTSGRAWVNLKADIGLVGFIRSLEVTVGARGWHPHLHNLVLTERPLSPGQRKALQAHAFGVWKRTIDRAGFRSPLPAFTLCEPIRNERSAGRYITKLSAALEVTRSYSKSARHGSRTPFQVLADFLQHGDDGDLTTWRRWERGMRGAKGLTFSRGLKARFQMKETTDEELAAVDAKGDLTYTYQPEEYSLVRRVPRGRLMALAIVQHQGLDGLMRWLDTLRQQVPVSQ
jgi:hypothetical protein